MFNDSFISSDNFCRLPTTFANNLDSDQLILGHYLPASETPFGWRFAGGPIVVRFYVLTGRSTNWVQSHYDSSLERSFEKKLILKSPDDNQSMKSYPASNMSKGLIK